MQLFFEGFAPPGPFFYIVLRDEYSLTFSSLFLVRKARLAQNILDFTKVSDLFASYNYNLHFNNSLV